MQIMKVLSVYRNDFHAIYECEHCKDSFTASGYHDDNFFDNVLPNVYCDKCGLNSDGKHYKEGKKKYSLYGRSG